MKLSLNRDDLLAALARVKGVVERRNTIPILANVKVEALGDRLVLTGTDLDIQVTTSAPAEVAAPGETTLPANTLHDVVNKLPKGGPVIIEQKGDGRDAQIRCGRSRFTLNTLPGADFPDLSVGELPFAFDLEPSKLADMIGRVKFAISTEETRYYLNGIYLHVPEGADALLTAVATDGHRLARHQLALPVGAAGMPGVIVPRKTVGHIERLVDAEAKEPVRLEVSPTKVRATIGATTLTSKLIDGTFPDYGHVIPQGNDKVAVVAKDDLAAAVDRVATVTSERGRAVKFSFSAGALVLSVTNPDAGAASDELEIDYAAEPLEIGFNAAYVRDILAAVPGPQVRLSLADPGSPCLIQPEDGSAALFVLMPMRV